MVTTFSPRASFPFNGDYATAEQKHVKLQAAILTHFEASYDSIFMSDDGSGNYISAIVGGESVTLGYLPDYAIDSTKNLYVQNESGTFAELVESTGSLEGDINWLTSTLASM